MTSITSIRAKEIKDSRGNPTLEVEVATKSGRGLCQVPSGASKGSHEAWELRDTDGGMSLALQAIKKMEEELLGVDAMNQRELDKKMLELDGTANKKSLGGNAMIGVSIAAARAAASEEGLELYQYIEKISGQEKSAPLLFVNLIEGGKHAKTKLAFQEYHFIPQTGDMESDFESIQAVQNELFNLPAVLGQGDEGGVFMDTEDVSKPLQILQEIVENAGLEKSSRFGLDIAASSFFKDEKYAADGKLMPRDEMIEKVEELAKGFSLLAVEDPLDEEDFAGFARLKKDMPQTTIVGDDLTVTNLERLKEAVDRESIGALIIKPNQIGTLSETIDVVRFAKDNGIKCVASHRSGETEDSFIADLAVALGCFAVKFGAMRTKERLSKYERLRQIHAQS